MSNSDSLSFCSLLGNTKKSMAANNRMYMSVEEFNTHYTCEKRVASFRRHINLPRTGDESDVILEACSKDEKANMTSH